MKKAIVRSVSAIGAVAALSLGLVTAPAPAQADPWGCTWEAGGIPGHRTYSTCDGGTGFHRAGMRCVDYFSGTVRHFYGDWVYSDETSVAFCTWTQWDVTHRWVDTD
ncbi:hypothetical protein GCM10027436_03220 [Actinophytocola sediminis]